MEQGEEIAEAGGSWHLSGGAPKTRIDGVRCRSKAMKAVVNEAKPEKKRRQSSRVTPKQGDEMVFEEGRKNTRRKKEKHREEKTQEEE